MIYIRLVLLAYAAVVVETSLADVWEKGDKSNLCEAPCGPSRQIGLIPFFPRPSLLPLVVVAVALTIEGWPAVVLAAGVGLLADCLSPGRLGVEMLCAIWVALVIQQFRRERTPKSALVLTGLSFFAVFAIQFSSTALRHVFAGQAVELAGLISAVIRVSAVSALVCLAVVLTGRSVKRLMIGN